MKKLIFLLIFVFSMALLNGQSINPDSYDGVPRSSKQRIFLDNFDDNRYFWIKDSSPSTHRIDDGFLYFSNEYDFTYTDGKPIAFDGNKNFEIESIIKFISGDVEAFNGILWGQLVFGKKYFFTYSSMGYYTITREDGFEKTEVIKPVKSSIINKTGSNDIVVRKYNDKYYFFINKNLVHTMDYEGLPGQYIGFKVAPNSLIRINFIRLWYIK